MPRDLHGVIRYRKHVVDEKRRALGELLRQEDYLRGSLVALDEEMQREAQIAASDSRGAGIGYGFYIQRAKDRRDALIAAIEEMGRRVDKAQEEVRESFKELKTFEIAQENRDEAERQERETKAQQTLDGIALDLHRRRGSTLGG